MSRKAPSKAVILAAGYGTRFDPITRDVPKPLLPVWGIPVLDHILGLLAEWGVRDVLINIHHRADRIFQHVIQRHEQGLRISLSFEPTILGTGGALGRAKWFLDDVPFWIVNSDVVFDLDPTPLLNAFRTFDPLAVLWMTHSLGPRTVEMSNNIVINFRSSRPGSPGTYTFCGLHLVAPRIVRYLTEEKFLSIISLYESAMRRGEIICGVHVPRAFWTDIGAPADYLAAHQRILVAGRKKMPGARFYNPGADFRHMRNLRGALAEGFTCVGQNVRIHPETEISNSVLMDGSRTTSGTCLREAILGPDVSISGIAGGLWVRADRGGDTRLVRTLKLLGWPVEKCALSFLPPRGSGRSFVRIALGRRRAIAVLYDAERRENAHYAACAEFLYRAGISVPKVLFHCPDEHVVMMEDIGDTSLQGLVPALPPRRLTNLYKRVVTEMARLHTVATKMAQIAPPPLAEPFSDAVYRYEHELFLSHLAANRLHLRQKHIEKLRLELASLPAVLEQETRVILHRDFQSSNVLVRKNKPVLIDFQGMRFGPAAYDLASLLCDPYVCLPEEFQRRMIEYYAALVGRSCESVFKVYWYAAVERLTQALGAFARFEANPETRHFAQHIAPGFAMLRRALSHLGSFPELTRLAEKYGDKK